MTRSELKSIINECIEDMLDERTNFTRNMKYRSTVAKNNRQVNNYSPRSIVNHTNISNNDDEEDLEEE